jgi:hypothetical protein
MYSYNSVDTQYTVVQRLFLEGYTVRHDNGKNVWMVSSSGESVYVYPDGSVVRV